MGTPGVPFFIFTYLNTAQAAARAAVAPHGHFSLLDYAKVFAKILRHFERFHFHAILEGVRLSFVVPGSPRRLAGVVAPVNEHLQVYTKRIRDPYYLFS